MLYLGLPTAAEPRTPAHLVCSVWLDRLLAATVLEPGSVTTWTAAIRHHPLSSGGTTAPELAAITQDLGAMGWDPMRLAVAAAPPTGSTSIRSEPRGWIGVRSPAASWTGTRILMINAASFRPSCQPDWPTRFATPCRHRSLIVGDAASERFRPWFPSTTQVIMRLNLTSDELLATTRGAQAP